MVTQHRPCLRQAEATSGGRCNPATCHPYLRLRLWSVPSRQPL